MPLTTYISRVNKIFNNRGAKEYFSPREIVLAVVNLLDAKRYLGKKEYFFVSVIYRAYGSLTDELYLSKEGFMDLANEIIAHFDLIAPYYKFCGDSRTMLIMALQEDDKYNYRLLAKELLNERAILGEEWMKLHEKFLKKFHS